MVLKMDAALDRKYVHKHLDENVFIKNLRRSIPTFIDKNTVEEIIIPSLSLGNRAQFLEYYVYHNPENNNIIQNDISVPDMQNKEGYILFNIPHTLEAEILESPENSIKLTQKDHKMILDYYLKNEKNGNYILKKHLTESEERMIQNILERRDIHIFDHERAALSKILESVEDFKKEDVFYANMLVDQRHGFFFEHSQEHVPGMMILEAARQFGTACFHIYGRIPLRGFQFMLNHLDSKFFDYVDLNYPIEMAGELPKLDRGKNGEWVTIAFKTTVFQKSEICAIIEMEGRIISKKLFQRLRQGRDDTNPAHRFYPVDTEICPISLWSAGNKNYYIGRLFDISYNGFCVEIEEVPKRTDKEYEFVMYFPKIGFIRGCCRLMWSNIENEAFFGGFHIFKAENADQVHLKEAIKRFCHVRMDRERV